MHLAAGILAGAVVCGVPWRCWAAGTPAGTVIQNTASASYTMGGVTSLVTSKTALVTVDELINVSVAALDANPTPTINGVATLGFAVANNGNGSEAFTLSANPALAGNPFVGTVQTVAIDRNNDGMYQPGTDTPIASGGGSVVIPPDGIFHILVIVAAPSGATDGQTSQLQLSAAWATGTGSPGTLFKSKGNSGVDAVIGASGGQGTARAPLIVNDANVALTKSATILDPKGGTTAVSGAIVTYTIVGQVSGTGTATGLTISDTFPANTTYIPGSVTLNGVALTDAADSDPGAATTNGISVALGNVKGGGPSQTVTFKVKLN